jgi:predicted lipoprotein with Yx(FWY)xxD motif
LSALAAVALTAGACGGAAEEPPSESKSTQSSGQEQEPAGKSAPDAIELASSDLGDILVDSAGMTLYMFMPDQEQGGKPSCYGECEETWPAFGSTDGLQVGDGLDESLLGSVERTDGTTQATYSGAPLYHFSGDDAPGDTNGQGLSDIWWVVSPKGEPVKEGTGDATRGGY